MATTRRKHTKTHKKIGITDPKKRAQAAQAMRERRRKMVYEAAMVIPPEHRKKTASQMPPEVIPLPLRAIAIKEDWDVARIEEEVRKAFALYFTGNLAQTLRLMKEDGWGDAIPTKTEALSWLWLPEVRAMLEKRLEQIPGYHPGIATREELQVFWTGIIRDSKAKMQHRLRASEYLARSHSMFIEKRELGINISLTELLREVESLEVTDGEFEVSTLEDSKK